MTEQAIAHFREHGWCVLRSAVPPQEASRLRAASERLLPDVAVPASPHGVPLVVQPSSLEPELRRWLEAPAIFGIAARALSAPSVQLLQDALLVKAPRTESALAWHQDASYFGYLEPISALSVRLALGHETSESGCLWVMDGSHRHPRGISRPPGTAATVEEHPDLPDFRRVPIELGAGDVSLHSAFTLHGSFSNHTAISRRTLVAHVASSACRVYPSRLPETARGIFPCADGSPLPAEAFYPLPLDVLANAEKNR